VSLPALGQAHRCGDRSPRRGPHAGRAEKAATRTARFREWIRRPVHASGGWTQGKGGYKDPFAADKCCSPSPKAKPRQHKDKLSAARCAQNPQNPNAEQYPSLLGARVSDSSQRLHRRRCTNREGAGPQDRPAELGLSGRSRSAVPFRSRKTASRCILNTELRYLGGGCIRLYNQFRGRANGDSTDRVRGNTGSSTRTSIRRR